MQETSKRSVLKSIGQQDGLEEAEENEDGLAR